MDDNLKKSIDKLIGERLCRHGINESPLANDAFLKLDSAYKALFETLNEDQKKLAVALENAYSVSDGESNNYFFRVGISDGVSIVLELLRK